MRKEAPEPAGGGEARFQPRLIAWEVTRRCPLSCRHCRASAADRDYAGELDTAECFRFLDGVAAFAGPIIILTGGEPMAREDIYRIAEHGTSLGLRMVMAPCGLLMDRDSTRRIIDAGIRRISLSIDGADRETHDAFRRVDGAFDSVLRAAALAREQGLEFQVNTTVTRLNVGQLDKILELAVSLGAAGYHPFLLVPTGRGRELADLAIDPQEYERVLTWIYRRSLDCPIPIKPTCAPHYYRILRQQEHQAGRTASQAAHGLNAMTKGCLGGQAFAFVSHTGKAQICGFLDLEAGDLRREGYDFRRIWEDSELFGSLRDPARYQGKCGACEYLGVCGGCRARAYAATGNYLAEEPFCVHVPRRATAGSAR
ncbi:MAG: radical SAM/SPASM domain-containing protein [Spirochaetes bacterium GWB1_66_5]|nr:MAG: radical SAM/SPASM domain-containing protein [Spirochaetes bacterium GWB1_66_5]